MLFREKNEAELEFEGFEGPVIERVGGGKLTPLQKRGCRTVQVPGVDTVPIDRRLTSTELEWK